MKKFEIVMHEIKKIPSNPFVAGWINETTRCRTAVIDCESEQKVREFFDDAVAKEYESVKGFKLTKITELKQ